MTKEWLSRALALLDRSLNPIATELNELDWKLTLSNNNEKTAKHLSAFANNAGGGFLVYGIDDSAKLVGISDDKVREIVEKLSNIARDALNPPVKLDYEVSQYNNENILFVYVHEVHEKPVHLSTINDTYIRSGGSTRKASPDDLKNLILNSKRLTYEELRATVLVDIKKALNILDYKTILTLLKKPDFSSDKELLGWLQQEKIIELHTDDDCYITNFGAICAAKNLKDSLFGDLERKTLRLIKYKEQNKIHTDFEKEYEQGYAISFQKLMDDLALILPKSEIIKHALREDELIYPEVALRELVANAIIHQDFMVSGKSIMIEIFSNRIEITNPGRLLPSQTIDRLIGTSPESRNEKLAAAFRRYSFCEERGTGLQKSIALIEIFGLPPLKFEEGSNYFKVTMFAPKKYADMSDDERLSACYQHAVIMHISTKAMTNTTLRGRLKMSEKQRPAISKLIKEALDKNLIKPKDPNNSSTKFTQYVPYWA